ncbi:Yip1 family protein [Algirhabdus cladophorae]|uniref:Yip1 family protein n=1 Tax=Algirhabdus cladophorae TaxID=3377108 RepID=UPI003B849223
MISQFTFLLNQTLRDPREGANTLLALGIPREALWPMAILVVIIGALISGTGEVISPTQIEGMEGITVPSPWILALIQFGALVISIFALFWMGRALDGQGSLDETILLMTWLQAVWLAGQMGVLVIAIVIPSLAVLLLIVFGLYMIWCMIVFIDVLHRLNSIGKAAMMLGLTVGAILLGMAVFLSLIGVGSTGGFANV